MAGRILVIRGGAIGDFVLTLPALGLLRDAFPEARIEILGYRHIVAIAVEREYADASRSIEYAPLAGFFNPKSDLDPELCAYFAGFNQIISYLFDPDSFFAGNLHRAGVRHLITGDPRISDERHAAAQLAAPLEQLALYLDDHSARIFPSQSDRAAAESILQGLLPPGDAPIVVVHPGSGSPRKNWPLDAWLELLHSLPAFIPGFQILLVSGESDTQRTQSLLAALPPDAVGVLKDLPLTTLGAIFSRASLFIGHDSGISHLAAASECPCVLLFGPTDPEIWAPANPRVRIVTSPTGVMADIALDTVRAAISDALRNG
jgi:heptosyltransferase-3